MDDDLLTTSTAAEAARAAQAEYGERDKLPIGTILQLMVAGLLIAAIVVFVLQNLESVPVDFLSWSFDMPLVILLAIALAAGVLFTSVFGFLRRRRG